MEVAIMPEIRNEPPRETGDTMAVEEFDRWYEHAHRVQAEFLFGVVYLKGPVRVDHGRMKARLCLLLNSYEQSIPNVEALIKPTIYLTNEIRVEPDLFMMVDARCGGTTKIADGLVHGPPELIWEIATSSASCDYHQKKEAYRLAGVQEYAIWNLHEQRLDWLVLRNGQYASIEPDDGLIKSEVYPGLWLDPQAMIARDFTAVDAALARGLASPEHAAFAAKLAAAGGSS